MLGSFTRQLSLSRPAIANFCRGVTSLSNFTGKRKVQPPLPFPGSGNSHYLNWKPEPCSFSGRTRLRFLTVLSPRMADARYCVEYAKTSRSSCKKCKAQIEKGSGRIGKITANPFSDDGGEMKAWYHMRCIFETFKVWLILLDCVQLVLGSRFTIAITLFKTDLL
jgi:hypothetical protein